MKARQARRRLDFTHTLTADLTKNHGLVGTEDLAVKSMTASAKGTIEAPGTKVAAKAGLNRGILDNTPGTRARQLDYKCAKLGSVHVRVPAPNTSRRCSRCKAVDPANRPGCGRIFACVACGHQDHADHNAAVNIREAAVARYEVVVPTAGPAGARAHNSTGRRKPSQSREAEGASVKQNTTSVVESRVA